MSGRVHGNDPQLEETVRTWLEQSRLTWPGVIELDLQRIDALEANADSREIFTQPGMTIQAGAPDNTVHIRWNDIADAVVHPTEPRATIRFTDAAIQTFEVAERGFLLVALLFVLRRVGRYHIHSAALEDQQGRGWLFVGQSHSGKSTTSALLGRNGWNICTDDIGFLVHVDGKVAVDGFWSHVALRAGGRELLGATGGVDMMRRQKMGFTPEALGGWAPQVVPEIIVLPTVGESTTMEPIKPMAAINGLIESSVWVLFENLHAQEHLDALSKLVAQSRCYRATLGPDLFDNPALLTEFVQ